MERAGRPETHGQELQIVVTQCTLQGNLCCEVLRVMHNKRNVQPEVLSREAYSVISSEEHKSCALWTCLP